MLQYPMAAVEILLRFRETNGNIVPSPAGPKEGSIFFRDGDLSARIVAIPSRVSWVCNDPRIADTATIEIAFSDLPVDPRSVERIGVVIYAWAENPADWAAMQSPTSNRKISLTRDRARFAGIVDDMSIQVGEKGDVVQLSCRDFTGLFLDADVPYAVHRSLNLNQPLVDVVQGLVSSLVSASSVKTVPDDDVKNVKLGVRLQKQLLGVKVEESDDGPGQLEYSAVKYWDLITDTCLKSGVVPYMDLDQIRLRKPSVLYGASAVNAPAWILGHNIRNMTVSQKFVKGQRKPVEVRCFDPVTGKTCSARHPESVKEAARILGKGKDGGEVEYSLHIVHGVTQEALPDIAEGLFNELAKQPMEIQFTTDYMGSFTADGEADLLTTKSGDPLAIYTISQQRNEAQQLMQPATMSEIASLSAGELEQRLQQRGIRSEVSLQMAKALKSGAQHSIFRTQSIEHSIDGADGYSAIGKLTAWREVGK